MSVIDVAAGIIISNSSVLLCRRGKGEKLEGFWEFPGGKKEQNESIYTCLERELREELGVIISATSIFKESLYEYEGGAINLIGLQAQILSGDITLTVHDKYVWVPIEQVLEYRLAPADIPIAETIIKEFS